MSVTVNMYRQDEDPLKWKRTSNMTRVPCIGESLALPENHRIFRVVNVIHMLRDEGEAGCDAEVMLEPIFVPLLPGIY